MTTKLVHFLLVFDHAEGRLVHQQYAGPQGANA